MQKKFSLSIAEIGFSFLFDQNFSEFEIEYNKDGFISCENAEVNFRVHRGEFPEICNKENIFSTDTWSLYRDEGKYVLQNSSFKSNLPPEKLVTFESDFKSGDIYIRDNRFDQNLLKDPLEYPLNQILMITLLSHGKGVMMHACGIQDKDYGYLFIGKSGSGKSTIAKLWSENGATVLNDDRIIIREKGGEFWIFGTPWHGDFNEVSSKALPIRKIFFLKHGKENTTVPKKNAEAVSMLLTRSFPPLWDQKGMDYTLSLLDQMASRLPCYELQFLPDKKIIDFVRNI